MFTNVVNLQSIATAPAGWRVNVVQVTRSACGHLLTNIGCWSSCGRWLYYDVRSDFSGSRFDGSRIERVDVDRGTVEVLYASQRGACCGAVTCAPHDLRCVFILGPDDPSDDWSYSASHRHGALLDSQLLAQVDDKTTHKPMRIDACCLTEPIPKGALRGGSHVHTFDGDGQWIAFTYEDHLLTAAMGHTGAERNQRNVGISVPGKSVIVPKDHPRNADGEYFSVLVSQTIDDPQPGSDEINRAYEDAWVGSLGYQRMDGSQQKRAIAFLGDTIADNGSRVTELFLLDLPDDLTQPGPDGPLGGTLRTRPRPPRGVTQTRLTHTADREFPGLQGPRHWPRSSPDGVHIACLMRDTYGVVQLWLVSPNGGAPQQLTWLSTPIASAFSFSPDGRWIAFVSDHSVCVTQVTDGHTVRLTARDDSIASPRPEACVFSPDGTRIAYVCSVPQGDNVYNQIFNVRVELPR